MKNHQRLPVYIGYDASEHDAFLLAREFVYDNARYPVDVRPVYQPGLRRAGLYARQEEERNGQRLDVQDGKPFSTDFSFTRFLVPALNQYLGHALFLDGDILLMGSIGWLLDEAFEQGEKAVWVVEHRHKGDEVVKMDGQVQAVYRRKNWSSFMLWDCAHPANAKLTPEVVNRETGGYLHGLGWLEDRDIGFLDERWNWLCGISPTTPQYLGADHDALVKLRPDVFGALHFTLGIPGIHEHAPETEFDHLYEGLGEIRARRGEYDIA